MTCWNILLNKRYYKKLFPLFNAFLKCRANEKKNKTFFVSERYSLLFLITITVFPGQKNVVAEDWKERSSVTTICLEMVV